MASDGATASAGAGAAAARTSRAGTGALCAHLAGKPRGGGKRIDGNVFVDVNCMCVLAEVV